MCAVWWLGRARQMCDTTAPAPSVVCVWSIVNSGQHGGASRHYTYKGGDDGAAVDHRAFLANGHGGAHAEQDPKDLDQHCTCMLNTQNNPECKRNQTRTRTKRQSPPPHPPTEQKGETQGMMM